MKLSRVILLSIFVVWSSACSVFFAAGDESRVKDARTKGQKFRELMPLVKDKKVLSYVDAIGRKLIAAAPKKSQKLNIPISFHVINANSGTSFTSGGYVFLERSRIDKAVSEGEIAGILGHEIAHNYLGHVIFVTNYDWCVEYFQLCYDKHYTYRREHELEADDMAVRMMTAAGYDPEDLAAYFLSEAKMLKSVGAQSYPSHPSLYERVRRIRGLAKTLKVSKKPIKMTDKLKETKQKLKSMKQQT